MLSPPQGQRTRYKRQKEGFYDHKCLVICCFDPSLIAASALLPSAHHGLFLLCHVPCHTTLPESVNCEMKLLQMQITINLSSFDFRCWDSLASNREVLKSLNSKDFKKREIHDFTACWQLQTAVQLIVTLVLD